MVDMSSLSITVFASIKALWHDHFPQAPDRSDRFIQMQPQVLPFHILWHYVLTETMAIPMQANSQQVLCGTVEVTMY